MWINHITTLTFGLKARSILSRNLADDSFEVAVNNTFFKFNILSLVLAHVDCELTLEHVTITWTRSIHLHNVIAIIHCIHDSCILLNLGLSKEEVAVVLTRLAILATKEVCGNVRVRSIGLGFCLAILNTIANYEGWVNIVNIGTSNSHNLLGLECEFLGSLLVGKHNLYPVALVEVHLAYALNFKVLITINRNILIN